MKKLFLLVLLLTICAVYFKSLEKKPSLAAENPIPSVFLLNGQILAENKAALQSGNEALQTAYKNLLIQANALLDKKAPSVVTKQEMPPSGDKHDYFSLAPYAWPDPKKPDGLPYIIYDGKTNPETRKISDQQNLNNMISWSHTLALAYYFSNDQRYANKAAELLRTWFVTPETKMNPNLNYAQKIPGRKNGTSAGIIDTHMLPDVIDTLGLLKNSGALTPPETQEINQWFGQYLNWVQTSEPGQEEAKTNNNHGSWYQVQVTTLLLYLGKKDAAKQQLEQTKAIINQQITSDGKEPGELSRTKSWDYSVFNLEALVRLASLGEKTGIDIWHYQSSDGKSIKKAIDFLIPYAQNKQQWNYPQIQKVQLTEFSTVLDIADPAYKETMYPQITQAQSYTDLLYRKPIPQKQISPTSAPRYRHRKFWFYKFFKIPSFPTVFLHSFHP